MRVLALGGSGGMGRYACRVASGLGGVQELVVADIDGERAGRFAGELGPKATCLTVDVGDQDSLARAVAGCDVVMNAVGPFFRFGVPILTAALGAGCHYVDICDDWEPTTGMLELGDAAERRGVTAIVGMGASPGLTNLLAVLAARELDTAREIFTGWNLEAAQPEKSAGPVPSAALVHGLRQITGSIRVLRHRDLVDEAPLRRTIVDYPGLGEASAWTFGHPEPITLGRAFEGLDSSLNLVHGRRGTPTLLRSLRWSIDHHVVSPGRALTVASWIERHLQPPTSSGMFSPKKLPPLFGYATGLRDGKLAAVGAAICRVPGASMGAVTGVPLAVGLQLLIEGDARKPGVFAPEAIVEPVRFFETLAGYCPGRPAPGDMVSIVRSWDPRAREQFRADSLSACRHADLAHLPS